MIGPTETEAGQAASRSRSAAADMGFIIVVWKAAGRGLACNTPGRLGRLVRLSDGVGECVRSSGGTVASDRLEQI